MIFASQPLEVFTDHGWEDPLLHKDLITTALVFDGESCRWGRVHAYGADYDGEMVQIGDWKYSPDERLSMIFKGKLQSRFAGDLEIGKTIELPMLPGSLAGSGRVAVTSLNAVVSRTHYRGPSLVVTASGAPVIRCGGVVRVLCVEPPLLGETERPKD